VNNLDYRNRRADYVNALIDNRPLKNAHLLRFAHPSSLRRTCLYASFLGISQALHLGMLSQPVNIGFFNTLMIKWDFDMQNAG